MFNHIYQSMKQGFQQSWFGFFFRYTALAQLMSRDEIPTAQIFFKTYLSSGWVSRLWFRACMPDYFLQLDEILKPLQVLNAVDLLTEDNCNQIILHANPGLLVNALWLLKLDGILNQPYFTVVAAHDNPYLLAAAFHSLQHDRILNQENSIMLAAHAYPDLLARVLSYLQKAGILTQENCIALIAPNHTILVSDEAHYKIWHRIPEHLLTQANFQRLLRAAEHANPMAALERERDQILDIPPQEGDVAVFNRDQILATPNIVVFNRSQSTHTASVHRSVSASAAKLMADYGDGLNVDAKIEEIKAFVNHLDDSPKHRAAKRCIQRITQGNYTFTDTSEVTTRQLLALAYTAIHDTSKCSATLEVAKGLFVDGLYEIQRGYNLNEAGQDLGGVDIPICHAGTFNKLMEKLNGIHQQVSVSFITHEVASFKFPKLAKACAKTYVSSLASPKTTSEYSEVNELLERLKTDESLESIWENIKEEVTQLMWEEFHEAYGDNQNHRQFNALITNGQCIGLDEDDLAAIESLLMESPDYQAYQKEEGKTQALASPLVICGLWSHGNADESSQKTEPANEPPQHTI